MAPIIASGLIELGKGLIDKFFPDPEQKAKANLDLLQMQVNGELKELEARMSAITEEAKSEDPWTSRARPSFLYVFYTILLFLVVIVPAIGVFYPAQMTAFFENVKKGFEAIPEELWWTFSVGYLGYTGFKSFEKKRK